MSLEQELPFYYEPEPVIAITPEIDRACRKDQVVERISFSDEDGQVDEKVTHMLNKK